MNSGVNNLDRSGPTETRPVRLPGQNNFETPPRVVTAAGPPSITNSAKPGTARLRAVLFRSHHM